MAYITLPSGLAVNFSDGTDVNQVLAWAHENHPEAFVTGPPKSSILGDAASGFGSGINSTIEGLSALVGAKGVQNWAAENKNYWDQNVSEAGKIAAAETQAKVQAAEQADGMLGGVWEGLKGAVKPATLPQTLGGLASFILPVGAGARLVGNIGKMAGAGEAALNASRLAAGVGVNAALGAGTGATSVIDHYADPDYHWESDPAYHIALAATGDPVAAQQKVITDAMRVNAALQATVFAGMGATQLGRTFAGVKAEEQAAGKFMPAALKSYAKEVPTQGAILAASKVAENYAVDQPLDQDVGGALGQGIALGAGLGGFPAYGHGRSAEGALAKQVAEAKIAHDAKVAEWKAFQAENDARLKAPDAENARLDELIKAQKIVDEAEALTVGPSKARFDLYQTNIADTAGRQNGWEPKTQPTLSAYGQPADDQFNGIPGTPAVRGTKGSKKKPGTPAVAAVPGQPYEQPIPKDFTPGVPQPLEPAKWHDMVDDLWGKPISAERRLEQLHAEDAAYKPNKEQKAWLANPTRTSEGNSFEAKGEQVPLPHEQADMFNDPQAEFNPEAKQKADTAPLTVPGTDKTIPGTFPSTPDTSHPFAVFSNGTLRDMFITGPLFKEHIKDLAPLVGLRIKDNRGEIIDKLHEVQDYIGERADALNTHGTTDTDAKNAADLTRAYSRINQFLNQKMGVLDKTEPVSLAPIDMHETTTTRDVPWSERAPQPQEYVPLESQRSEQYWKDNIRQPELDLGVDNGGRTSHENRNSDFDPTPRATTREELRDYGDDLYGKPKAADRVVDELRGGEYGPDNEHQLELPYGAEDGRTGVGGDVSPATGERRRYEFLDADRMGHARESTGDATVPERRGNDPLTYPEGAEDFGRHTRELRALLHGEHPLLRNNVSDDQTAAHQRIQELVAKINPAVQGKNALNEAVNIVQKHARWAPTHAEHVSKGGGEHRLDTDLWQKKVDAHYEPLVKKLMVQAAAVKTKAKADEYHDARAIIELLHDAVAERTPGEFEHAAKHARAMVEALGDSEKNGIKVALNRALKPPKEDLSKSSAGSVKIDETPPEDSASGLDIGDVDTSFLRKHEIETSAYNSDTGRMELGKFNALEALEGIRDEIDGLDSVLRDIGGHCD